MSGPYAALWRIVEASAPLVVVVYTDPESREDWLDEVDALFRRAGGEVQRTDTVEELLTQLNSPILVVPEPEAETDLIEQLSVMRDRLNRRQAPAALFLLRGGPGLEALTVQAALASFLQGLVVDPNLEGELDLAAERKRFQDEFDETPDAWLARFRAGETPDTLDNALLYLRALLLEEP